MNDDILLELKSNEKLRVGNDIKERNRNLLLFLGFIIFGALACINTSYNFYFMSLNAITIIISVGLGLTLIGCLFVLPVISTNTNYFRITNDAIILLDQKYIPIKTFILANVYWFHHRKYEVEDGWINHLIIIYEGKEEYIDLSTLNEKQISELLAQIELLNFEITIINR